MNKQRFMSLITIFFPKTPYVMVYMLQQVEYMPQAFLDWGKRWPDFRKVMTRQKLQHTAKSLALLVVAYIAYFACWSVVIYLAWAKLYSLAFLALLALPSTVQICLIVPILLGLPFLKAKRSRIMHAAEAKMAKHPGIKIAVLGSYGKTTAKEILATVLAEGKKVAVTPGNKNVAISHARWITRELKGDEDVVIFEYGEFRPGDIKAFAKLTHPNIAVLTGFAPNHLDTYGSETVLQIDLASIENFVHPADLFVARQATGLPFTKAGFTVFDDKKVLDWQIKRIKTGFDGTQFTMQKGKEKLDLHSDLLGEQAVPVLAVAAALADALGQKKSEIVAGIAKTKPFEHRLQPRELNGAWIIDDTYNGNIEGMRAGLELLASLPAKRRMYVTPGLVEQGDQTVAVHKELGRLIAKAEPDEVVLMKNSTTPLIVGALTKHGFKGKTTVKTDPLHYYEHLPYELAAGDVVLLQNDWTDNYN